MEGKDVFKYESPRKKYSTRPIRKRFGKYKVELRLPIESENYDLERKRLQVNVTSEQGEEYYADFVTLDYIRGIMDEKLKEIGNGMYFLGRDRIILRDLSDFTVNKTLEDLLLNWRNRLEYYFKKR